MCPRIRPTQSHTNHHSERHDFHSECHITAGEFRVVVAEAVELIEEYDMDSFAAADCVATKRDLVDFDGFLEAVRATVRARAQLR